MEQKAIWNGANGLAWVESQELLDGLLLPFEKLLLEAVSGERVLDVGCGTGGTTRAFGGRATGIDISEPMIEKARSRGGAEYILADAQTHVFEPASFDAIVSRFGVMFFDDPIAAFANLRRAAKPGAALAFVAWRSAAENPFMTTAERAAAPLLPGIPPRKPDGPGQFAFADRDRVRRILETSGWSAIDIAPVDVVCTMPEKDLKRYVTRLGPLGRALDEASEATRNEIVATVRRAFDPYVHGPEVRASSASWLVRATMPG